MKLDEQTLERIIEQVTRQVMILVQREQEGGASAQDLSAGNYFDRVQPFVHAGADRLASTLGVAPTDGRVSHMIDHTLLKPDATQDQIAQLCYEARKHAFASVCVNPSYVKLCADLLKDSDVLVCTVVGFPLGATSTEAKAFEAQKALRDGAIEVDMVINVGALKSRDYERVERDIAAVARACTPGEPSSRSSSRRRSCRTRRRSPRASWPRSRAPTSSRRRPGSGPGARPRRTWR